MVLAEAACGLLLQGLEKDVIILSTTVMQPGDFASDAQRLNVALTRAKHHLIVVGYGPAISTMPGALQALYLTCKDTANSYHSGMGLCLPADLCRLSGT